MGEVMMCQTPNRILLVAITATLSLALGCRQSPWEDLVPPYTEGMVPQVYKFRDLYPDLRSTWTSEGRLSDKRLWTVGDEGTILESDDGSEHWNARDSGTQNLPGSREPTLSWTQFHSNPWSMRQGDLSRISAQRFSNVAFAAHLGGGNR